MVLVLARTKVTGHRSKVIGHAFEIMTPSSDGCCTSPARTQGARQAGRRRGKRCSPLHTWAEHSMILF